MAGQADDLVLCHLGIGREWETIKGLGNCTEKKQAEVGDPDPRLLSAV